MRVYILYFDGRLDSNYNMFVEAHDWGRNNLKDQFFEIIKVDSVDGYSRNIEKYKEEVESAKSKNKDLIILTNQVMLLDYKDSWNGEYYDIYLYNEDSAQFVSVHKLTEKDLRVSHNIMKLYVAGHFNI